MVTADIPVILLSQSESISPSIQGSNCCFFTHMQVSQGIGKMVWYFTLFLMNYVHHGEYPAFLEEDHTEKLLWNPMRLGLGIRQV